MSSLHLGLLCVFLAMLSIAGTASAAEPAPAAGEISLQHFDDVPVQKFPWGWIRWTMNSQLDPHAEMTVGIVHVEPNQTNALHIHPNCTEYIHVLSGSCEHRVGDRWVPLKTGDTLRIPRNVVHQARTGAETCRMMVICDTGTRQMVPVKE
jgi:quercetin dioxygenase-like cupin family protein